MGRMGDEDRVMNGDRVAGGVGANGMVCDGDGECPETCLFGGGNNALVGTARLLSLVPGLRNAGPSSGR